MDMHTKVLLSTSIEVLAQTFAYGIFVSLMPTAIRVLLRQGSRRGPSSILLYLTIASFLLSTAYWALSVSLNDIRTTFNAPHFFLCYSYSPIPSMKVLFADGVVVWRMYILCALDFPKGILSIPILFFGILFVSIVGTIVLRIIATVSHRPTAYIFNVIQECSSISSLITNLAATAIICTWVWQRRRALQGTMRNTAGTNARIEQMTVLLAESGIVYCILSRIRYTYFTR
ncbi:hypothetical protein BC629DRAFT_1522628 [Irpex lacteus]|nr:hypothetical protein BC629DRAFT_1522628 [Irpex lacteus]